MESKNNRKKGACLAILGTGSDVGKSIIVTALCRCFKNKGINVAPFKAQNMSNNSGVTPEGLEMGRAQIVQAEAAGIPPHVDMNPILLKPTSDVGSQVILLGKAVENMTAGAYYEQKDILFSKACAALDRLREKYDLIIMEGAGSCAEVNLMGNDIVNLPMAEYADASVILVADIHRGGVFGQIIGTLECLEPPGRNAIAGFIINRFRGDITLFSKGVEWIENKTGKKVFGVLPWYKHISIEAEDSVVIEKLPMVESEPGKFPAVGVIRFPHISNFTDFDPLIRINDLNLCFLEKAQDISNFSAIILPGSKNTRFDLEWLHTTGWAEQLLLFKKNGGHILGICGGYQMLGQTVHDPDGLEGKPGTSRGLSFLHVETFLEAPKTTTRTRFSRGDLRGTGYEIHMGHTRNLSERAMFQVYERNGRACEDKDGCVSDDLGIMGTYMHGLFDSPEITGMWLAGIDLGGLEVSEMSGPASRDGQYDLLSEHFEEYIDVPGIMELLPGVD